MARSKWKFKYLKSSLWKKNLLILRGKKIKYLKTFSGFSIIPTNFFKKILFIYKGNCYKTLFITKKHFFLKINKFLFFKKPFNFPLKLLKKNNCIRR